MIQDSHSKAGDGVPFLRRIPLFGELFGSTDRKKTRTELIVLLTPHVIRSEEESSAVMKDLEQEFRGLRRNMPGLLAEPVEANKKAPDPKTEADGHDSGPPNAPPPTR